MSARRRARAPLSERRQDGENRRDQRTETDDSGRRRRCRQHRAHMGSTHEGYTAEIDENRHQQEETSIGNSTSTKQIGVD